MQNGSAPRMCRSSASGEVAEQGVGVAQHADLADTGDALVGPQLDEGEVAPRRADDGGSQRGDPHSCQAPPRRTGTSAPSSAMPLTSTSSPPIMKSTWMPEAFTLSRSSAPAVNA